jgi:hypothetical protein
MPFHYDDSYIFIHTFSQFVVALLHLEGSLLMLLSVSEMLAEKDKRGIGYVSLTYKNILNSYLYLNK